MKENKLVAYLDLNGDIAPIDQATLRMERFTQYWPPTISSTMIYNMGAHVEFLTKLIVNEELTDEQVLECKKVIYNLVAMESRNEAFPATCSSYRDRSTKGNRREEQYRILFEVGENTFPRISMMLFMTRVFLYFYNRNVKYCCVIIAEASSISGYWVAFLNAGLKGLA